MAVVRRHDVKWLPKMEGLRRKRHRRKRASNRRTSSIIGIGVNDRLVANRWQTSRKTLPTCLKGFVAIRKSVEPSPLGGV